MYVLAILMYKPRRKAWHLSL